MRMRLLVLAVVISILPTASASGQWLRTGRLDNAMDRGDDNFASSNIGFNINFFGNIGSNAVVCTNGYTIVGDLAPGGDTCTFPNEFAAGTPRISNMSSFYGAVMAPYFTDLNTVFPDAGNQGGQIFTSTDNIGGLAAWSATWDAVRGWPFSGATATQRVTFQMVLAQLGANTHVLEFNYGQLDWNAEGGVGFTHDRAFSASASTTEISATSASRAFSRFTCIFNAGEVTTCGFNTDLTTVPEPTSLALVVAGLVGIAVATRRRRRVRALLDDSVTQASRLNP